MQNKEDRLEFFKNVLTSTIKSIAEKKDCEVKFGKSLSESKNNEVVNLPELNKLENLSDFVSFRAKADSEALRLKYSNNKIFEQYKPKGEMSKKLYKIAEKIRYEKIGSRVFEGVKKNLFFEYSLNSKKTNSNKNKLEVSFENYLKNFFFNIKEIKKPKIDFSKKFKQNLSFLNENLNN
jgi:cobaltochelatase CobT